MTNADQVRAIMISCNDRFSRNTDGINRLKGATRPTSSNNGNVSNVNQLVSLPVSPFKTVHTLSCD